MSLYSVFDYGGMIADRARLDAYVRALRRTITPESVVLDIGTGTGIFALLACQLGARRVYAVEPDDAIQVAREIARANGFAGRLEFIQKLSTDVTLAERADVIVSDLGGLLPWFQHHIPSIIDARQRLLAPQGRLIPERDRAWAAIVHAPEFYARYTAGWDAAHFGLDMSAARRIALNTMRRFRLTPDHLLTEPRQWAILDYATVTGTDIHAEISWTLPNSGTAHGLSCWFDRTLTDGVELSNAPGVSEPLAPVIYASLFFPWAAPIAINAGDHIAITLAANLVGDDYIWRWQARLFDQGHEENLKAEFKQSTFFSAPLSPKQFHKRSSSYVPTLDAAGAIDRFVLERMAGNRTLAQIADEVVRQFPNHFSSWHAALDRIGELSQKYAR
jgi:protein arginine N-methyltransferase 1